ncbi:MAG: 30S ribosomal protein S13 [Dehalococcoidia bacterium]|jgi:small subunit ribosomal protein S13|uniref:Small ribosomal subunit protein uS13 n=1 Tax=Tepidiforma bonchosmolovskayae TaxID=2601677 RepID=A0ABX6C2M0_9CHLR|nr:MULTISPECIES: 30S ribosomal protein S13 [Tepidiforma]MCL6643430.1 30S ribosomal protein S13 [Dehalococcoidia bacterium]QFG03526.1 30S ribosomal protein S13 [Tepidiforma bonchosmolovskayae]GIW16424.1 MAG: 30S ribosomal protein S13 [Tepidiforma sp.]
MARIAGVDIPADKRLEVALTYIYGIGPTRAKEVLAATGISPDARARDLTDEEILRIRDFIEKNYVVEGDLRREVRQNIARLIEINCYRGQRHRRNLPVRGQRTRTNARQKRGARKTVAGKKRAGKK